MPGRNFDLGISIIAINLAQSELKWRPTISLEDGIRATYDHLTSH